MMDREEQVALAHRVDVLRLSFFQNLRHNALLLGGAVDGFFQVRCVVLPRRLPTISVMAVI